MLVPIYDRAPHVKIYSYRRDIFPLPLCGLGEGVAARTQLAAKPPASRIVQSVLGNAIASASEVFGSEARKRQERRKTVGTEITEEDGRHGEEVRDASLLAFSVSSVFLRDLRVHW